MFGAFEYLANVSARFEDLFVEKNVIVGLICIYANEVQCWLIVGLLVIQVGGKSSD